MAELDAEIQRVLDEGSFATMDQLMLKVGLSPQIRELIAMKAVVVASEGVTAGAKPFEVQSIKPRRGITDRYA